MNLRQLCIEWKITIKENEYFCLLGINELQAPQHINKLICISNRGFPAI